MSFKDIADALLGRKSVIPEMNELAYRPSVLPVARTKGGELTAAWPQIVTEPLQNIRAFMDDPSAATAAPVALDMAGGGMLVGSAPAGALAANAGRRAANKGITAYHGSPHDFDRFSLDKIGTGEGAQAYGHGLYFAENEGVAKAYRDQLSGGRMSGAGVRFDGGDPFDAPNGSQAMLAELDPILKKNGSVDATIADLEKRATEGRFDYQRIRAQDMLDFLRTNRDRVEYSPPGRMYKVRINADPDEFLDYDGTWSQQSPINQERLKQVFAEEIAAEPGLDLGGLAMSAPRPEEMQRLREAGIPGVRYYDQGSRGAAEGTRNYVVFDDSLIDILEKYGIANPFGPRMDDPDRNTKEWLARFDPRRVN